MARVSAEAVLQQEHRTTGLRKAETLWAQAALYNGHKMREEYKTKREANTGDGQGHSSSYTHANGIALVQQLP